MLRKGERVGERSDGGWKEWPRIALESHFHVDLARRRDDETKEEVGEGCP